MAVICMNEAMALYLLHSDSEIFSAERKSHALILHRKI